jgi:hypothetical protein
MAMRPTINRHKIKLDEYAFALGIAIMSLKFAFVR